MDVEKIWEVLLEIRDSQTRTEADVAHHIKRTATLENWVEKQEERLTEVETSRANILFLGKTVAALVAVSGGIVGIIYTLMGILK